MKHIFLFVTLLWAGTVSACSFAPDADIFKEPQDNVNNYAYVVSGTFSAVTEKSEQHMGRTYVFDIYETHKGDIDAETLNLESPGHSCGYFGQTGGHVLLFLNSLETIDESAPKYFYDSREEVITAANSIAVDDGETVDPESQIAPDNCKVWYDGCNTCMRGELGGPLACTRMACLVQQPTECREYFNDPKPADGETTKPSDQDKDTIPYVQGPTTQPGEGFVGPTTSPPYENRPTQPEKTAKSTWWQSIIDWITGLFSW